MCTSFFVINAAQHDSAMEDPAPEGSGVQGVQMAAARGGGDDGGNMPAATGRGPVNGCQANSRINLSANLVPESIWVSLEMSSLGVESEESSLGARAVESTPIQRWVSWESDSGEEHMG